MTVRKQLKPYADRNAKQMAAREAYDDLTLTATSSSSASASASASAHEDFIDSSSSSSSHSSSSSSSVLTATAARARAKQRDRVLECIVELREYDVTYDQRVCIDTGYRVGVWYDVKIVTGTPGYVAVASDGKTWQWRELH